MEAFSSRRILAEINQDENINHSCSTTVTLEHDVGHSFTCSSEMHIDTMIDLSDTSLHRKLHLCGLRKEYAQTLCSGVAHY